MRAETIFNAGNRLKELTGWEELDAESLMDSLPGPRVILKRRKNGYFAKWDSRHIEFYAEDETAQGALILLALRLKDEGVF